MKGIDISKWNAGLSLKSVVRDGFSFVIIRAAYTGNGQVRTHNVDPYFERFYKEAKDNNLKVGAYYYSCATNYEEGKAEAMFLYDNCLHGKTLDFPVYIDVEDKWQQNQANKQGNTDAVIGFCDYLLERGINAGVYASRSWFGVFIDWTRLEKYTKWVASWSASEPQVPFQYDMWQFSEDGSIDGKRVDLNIAYTDFSQGVTPAQPAKEVTDGLIQDIIGGKYGNGAERKAALEAEGYNYSEVQAKVNEYFKNTPSAAPATPAKKTLAELVTAVINGEYGAGSERKQRLEAEGYNYKEVQDAVNKKLAKPTITEDLIQAVLRGEYGNGAARKQKLEAEGYNYKEVQDAINKRLK